MPSFASNQLRARWVVRRLLEDTLALFPDDAEMVYAIQQGLALDGLHLDLREPPLAKRLTDALLETIERQSADSGAGPLKWSPVPTGLARTEGDVDGVEGRCGPVYISPYFNLHLG